MLKILIFVVIYWRIDYRTTHLCSKKEKTLNHPKILSRVPKVKLNCHLLYINKIFRIFAMSLETHGIQTLFK